MIANPHVRPVRTSDPGTMAEETARVRWPRIVQDMIDDVEQTVQDQALSSSMKEEGIAIVQKLKTLKSDIIEDKSLTKLPDHEDPDLQWFNKHIMSPDTNTWRDAPWLLAECYMYRHVQSIFSDSSFWARYDVFQRQKESTFLNSKTAVQELALQYTDTVQDLRDLSLSTDQQFSLFSEMTQVALWGNATDLSLLTHLSLEELQSLQERETIRQSEQKIVDNDLPEVWSYLNSATYTSSDRKVDIILDNSGFELFTDLVLATYLLDRKIAKQIRLHVKDFPWFVSDAMRSDVEWLLKALRSDDLSDHTGTGVLCSRLEDFFASGELDIASHWFWTTGSSYHEMQERAPDLLADLRGRDLVIFKGDLHYRKLTGDGLWPHLTSFKEALGSLMDRPGLRLLSLRTNKADVCVGLESEEQLDDLEKACPNEGWVRNGKYAVASFAQAT